MAILRTLSIEHRCCLRLLVCFVACAASLHRVAPQSRSSTVLFITHRKMGCNLLANACNVVAPALTGEPCVWCNTIQNVGPDWFECYTDGQHHLNGTDQGLNRFPANRMAIVSSLNRSEARRLATSALPFRAVHTVRAPIDSLVSSYAYDWKLMNDARYQEYSWDVYVRNLADVTTQRGLALEYASMRPVLWDAHDSFQELSEDKRVLTMELQEFEENTDASVSRMLRFLGVADDLHVVSDAVQRCQPRADAPYRNKEVSGLDLDHVRRTVQYMVYQEHPSLPDFARLCHFYDSLRERLRRLVGSKSE